MREMSRSFTETSELLSTDGHFAFVFASVRFSPHSTQEMSFLSIGSFMLSLIQLARP